MINAQETKGVAAVVGVGAGLGTALARRFAGPYAVALMARDEGKLQQFADEIAATGGRAIAVSVDVSKAEEIHAAFERTRNELGEVDVLLYNAAMRPFGRLMETKPSTFETTWRVNAFGAFLCSQQVVPAMLSKGHGVVIFTGATAGTRPFATSAAFGPAKFAMRGLAQVMAEEPRTPGRARGVREHRWRHRHALHSQPSSRSEAGGHAQSGGDRRKLLARGASASERLDTGARSQALQRKVLRRQAKGASSAIQLSTQ